MEKTISNNLRARLGNAARAGEIVSVVYHRGSQPGSVREIVPLEVSDDDLRAHDVAARIDKSFKLAYLEMADSPERVPAYNPTRPVEAGHTLQVAFESYIPELRATGQNDELLTGIVIKVTGGSMLHLKIQETIYHSGVVVAM